MSDKPEEKAKEPENAADSKEKTQADATTEDDTKATAEEDAAPSEDKPEAATEKPTKAPEKPSTAKDKPLDKMTVKELREIAKDIPGITGVHAMKKDELITEIKAAKGIKDKPVKKAAGTTQEYKLKIRALKAERQAALEAKDRKKATILRRRISRLKKKTRKVAA